MVKAKGAKFYAVRCGRRPGVYSTWDEARAQVNGCPGSLHKSFSSLEDAQRYVDEGPAPAAGAQGAHSPHSVAKRPAKKAKRPATSSDMSVVGDDVPPAALVLGATQPVDAAQYPATSAGRPAAHAEALFRLEFDGASRGNPGRGGAGAVLFCEDSGEEVCRMCLNLGENVTNNQAEYQGLIIGLRAASSLGVQHLRAFGDSQLIVHQVNGKYSVRQERLRPLHATVMRLKGLFRSFTISHVYREDNKIADALSNEAIDTCGWQGMKDPQGRVWDDRLVAVRPADALAPQSNAQWAPQPVSATFPGGTGLASYVWRLGVGGGSAPVEDELLGNAEERCVKRPRASGTWLV